MIHSFSRSPEKTNQKRGATPKAPYIGGCKRKARTPDAFRAFLVSRDTRCRFFRLAHEEQHVFAPFRVSCESLSKGRRQQGCRKEYRVSRDTKEARESSVVRDSRLHPSPGGRPWMGECFFATFFAPKKRRRKVFAE